jgi:hypothetical protein
MTELEQIRQNFIKEFDFEKTYQLPVHEQNILNRLKFEYDKLHNYWYDDDTMWPDDFDVENCLGEMEDIIYLYQNPPVDLLITKENISNFHNNKLKEFARCINKLKKYSK